MQVETSILLFFKFVTGLNNTREIITKAFFSGKEKNKQTKKEIKHFNLFFLNVKSVVEIYFIGTVKYKEVNILKSF